MNWILLSLVPLLLAGCAMVNVPNIGQKGYALEDDERRLYKRSAEICEIVDETDEVYPNQQFEAYLNRLVNQLAAGVEVGEITKISVKVLNDPSFNAFSLPNGRIYLNIGALSAAENEAQLATLLGHELTHVLHRHALRQFRSIQNKSAFMAVLDIPLSLGGSAGILLGNLGMLSSIYGYSQQNEFEADEVGFEMIRKQGYDARESSKFFENLLTFIKTEEVPQPFFFSTHPNVKARIKNFNQLLVEKNFEPGPGLIVDTPDFQRFAYEIYTADIVLCLSRGMFKTADQTFENLTKRYGDQAETFYWGGEIYRQRQDHDRRAKRRDKTADYPKANEWYDKALALDENYAPALAGKARVLGKMGEKEESKKFFKKYLQLKPDAPDRGYIEQMING